MTKLMTTLTISTIASIMIIGGFILAPDAYSDKNHDDVLDECSCKKPHTLTVLFEAPDDAPIDATYRVEIFKKLDDRDNEEKQLGPHILVVDNGNITIFASNFGKDKLESNTAFVIYEVDGEYDDVNDVYSDKLVSLMEIHTSCSKPLFIDMIVDDSETTDNGFKLIVKDGLSGDNPAMTSIPIGEPLTCEDKKQKSTGTITVRKAITNDNGGTKEAKDFVITLNDVETGDIIETLVQEDLDVPIFTATVPAGTYKLSETGTEGYDIVLIAGDTYCPSMVDEPFTIKKNKNLSCTIYNDDKDDGSGGSGGIVFQNESLQVQLDANMLNDSCDQYTIKEKNITPCIEIINKNSGDIAIVDSALISSTTIILFSVAQEEQLDSDTGALNPNCSQFTIIRHDKQVFTLQDDDLSFPTIPTEHLVVVLQCANMDPSKVYNVNYVMIDPTM